MIWILSVETQRVHRKIFIHYVFTSRNRSGGEKSEFFWVRISANLNSNYTICTPQSADTLEL